MRWWQTCLSLAVVIAAASAQAQQSARAPRQPVSIAAQSLSDSEIQAAFLGKKVEWGGLGIADYKIDGGYEYTVKTNGQHIPGKFLVGANRLCYEFANGKSQCDRIMRDRDGVYMINAEGAQFRARFLE